MKKSVKYKDQESKYYNIRFDKNEEKWCYFNRNDKDKTPIIHFFSLDDAFDYLEKIKEIDSYG